MSIFCSISKLSDVADLDNDGDIEAIFGWWTTPFIFENKGGSVTFNIESTAPMKMDDDEKNDVLKLSARHNGRELDNDIEIKQIKIKFTNNEGTMYSSSQINYFVDKLYFYHSGNETWENTDTIIKTISALNLSGGFQTINFTDGDSKVCISGNETKYFFIVLEIKPNISSEIPKIYFQISTKPDRDFIVEDYIEDTSIPIQDHDRDSIAGLIGLWTSTNESDNISRSVTFSGRINIGKAVSEIYAIDSGDLDGDGDIDIVNCNYQGICIWENDGTPWNYWGSTLIDDSRRNFVNDVQLVD